jgi:hypothetical protein
MSVAQKLACLPLGFLVVALGCAPQETLIRTYTVRYDANGATIGIAPTDPNLYTEGQAVIVFGNTGGLQQTYQAFRGWNTRPDGTGADYSSGVSFLMSSSDVTLYAVWSDYVTGDTGPAGGLIFHDQGAALNGWRFLECAASDQSQATAWCTGSVGGISTDTSVGSGKANTIAIVQALGTNAYAATLCTNLTAGGYNDWFLPSSEELHLIYQNLKLAGVGGFASGYWASTLYGTSEARTVSFANGEIASTALFFGVPVRAIRSF